MKRNPIVFEPCNIDGTPNEHGDFCKCQLCKEIMNFEKGADHQCPAVKKEQFKEMMKDVMDEALEEFTQQDIRIPHPLINYECPECCSKKDFRRKDQDSPIFVCAKCACEAKLQFIITKKGKDGY